MSYTVEDLIGVLEEMDPQAPVMVAVQPVSLVLSMLRMGRYTLHPDRKVIYP